MERFMNYLTQKIDECRELIGALENDGRQDEANFAKVRMNIYDVCRTVINALAARPGAGPDAVKAQFERFSREWNAALDKAREHGDHRNTVIGETKIEALEDVMEHFKEEI